MGGGRVVHGGCDEIILVSSLTLELDKERLRTSFVIMLVLERSTLRGSAIGSVRFNGWLASVTIRSTWRRTMSKEIVEISVHQVCLVFIYEIFA